MFAEQALGDITKRQTLLRQALVESHDRSSHGWTWHIEEEEKKRKKKKKRKKEQWE